MNDSFLDRKESNCCPCVPSSDDCSQLRFSPFCRQVHPWFPLRVLYQENSFYQLHYLLCSKKCKDTQYPSYYLLQCNISSSHPPRLFHLNPSAKPMCQVL